MARNQKNVKNDTKTLLDMEYREKHWKTWKMKNAQCRTWNVAKKKKKKKKKTEIHGKWETHTIGPGTCCEIE